MLRVEENLPTPLQEEEEQTRISKAHAHAVRAEDDQQKAREGTQGPFCVGGGYGADSVLCPTEDAGLWSFALRR